LTRLQFSDQRGVVGLEAGQTSCSGERLVVTEEAQDGVGLGKRQVVLQRGASGNAGAVGHLVTAVPQIPNHQFLADLCTLQQRFQPAIMLHPVGQRIADQADSFSAGERRRRIDGRIRRLPLQAQGYHHTGYQPPRSLPPDHSDTPPFAGSSAIALPVEAPKQTLRPAAAARGPAESRDKPQGVQPRGGNL
jgi:hypothetical protein